MEKLKLTSILPEIVKEDFNPNVAPGSTYAIQISKLPNGKIVLTQDNGQEIVIHPEDVQDVIKFLQKFSK
jgi:hypothetical protein